MRALPSRQGQRRPVVLGHSGWIHSNDMARHVGDQLDGVIVLDSFVMPPKKRPCRADKPKAEVVCHKRRTARPLFLATTAGVQEPLPFRLHSCKISARGGWKGFTWKFDKSLVQKTPQNDDPGYPVMQSKRLQGLKCRAQFFYGTASHFFVDPTAEYMQQELDEHKPGGEPSLLVPIQGAAHHMMADQPVGVISAIAVVLAQWARKGAAVVLVRCVSCQQDCRKDMLV